MLFSESPRFTGGMTSLKGTRGQIMAHSKTQTDNSVGPGAYHVSDVENKRNGWGSNSFSKRQPMTPPSKHARDRGDYYVAGQLHSSQYIAAPLSVHNCKSPGVGAYNLDSSFGKGGTSPLVKKNMGSAAQRATQATWKDNSKTVLVNGLVAQSVEANNANLGPGAYYIPSDLIKPSHNKRVKGHNRTRSDQSTRSDYSFSRNGGSGMSTPRSMSMTPRSTGSRSRQSLSGYSSPTDKYAHRNDAPTPDQYVFEDIY